MPRPRATIRWLAVALSVPLLAACSLLGSGPDRGTSPAPVPRPAGTQALFGAYVAPDTYTDPGRLAALQRFEGALGRRVSLVMSYHPFTQEFPRTFDLTIAHRKRTRLVLSWNGTDTRAIAAGQYDDLIRERARALKELDRPVLLRWKWEMNRPNIQAEVHGPREYVAAWRHIRRIFDQVGTPRVAWVWCPSANTWTATEGWRYYPADDQVDWLCADAYTPTPATSLSSVLRPFLAWAERHPKPLLVAEFGTRRGVKGARAAWLDAGMAYLRSRGQVRGVMYYESASAPTGRYDLASEPDAFAVLRRWGLTTWLSARPGRVDRR